MWTFELYRILTAQRIAEALRERERSPSAAPARVQAHPGREATAHPLWSMAKVFLRRSILPVHSRRHGRMPFSS